jgi:hypothetical protein
MQLFRTKVSRNCILVVYFFGARKSAKICANTAFKMLLKFTHGLFRAIEQLQVLKVADKNPSNIKS